MCNILTTMLRPNFEDPLNTAQQLVDNNITLYFGPPYHIWRQFLAKSPIPEYNKLAETMVITKDWDEFKNYSRHNVIGKGTHAQMTSYLWNGELDMGRWWRSREILKEDSPYAGYQSNPKWIFNEVC